MAMRGSGVAVGEAAETEVVLEMAEVMTGYRSWPKDRNGFELPDIQPCVPIGHTIRSVKPAYVQTPEVARADDIDLEIPDREESRPWPAPFRCRETVLERESLVLLE